MGDFEPLLTCDDNARVSSVNAEPLTELLANFLDEGCRRRKTDFHEWELGLCGELVGVSMLWVVGDRAWRETDSMKRGEEQKEMMRTTEHRAQ